MKDHESGVQARAGGIEVSTQWVDSLPILNQILGRMRLRELLHQYLPRPGKSPKVPVADVVLTLVRNILLAREPLYGVDEWAKHYAPDLLELTPEQVEALNDDRVGRCLEEIFRSDSSSLVIALSAHVVKEFEVSLKELHNDSTTVSFFGQYEDAEEPHLKDGKTTRAITRGKSKDHRPDLKQLLFILTASHDEGVPLYFTASDGNTSDAKTHIDSWELLCQITGRRDFLYVADSKLASAENMDYIHQHGGRFLTVLPRTFRRELREFREQAMAQELTFGRPLERGRTTDVNRLAQETRTKAGGYRLLWYHSSHKQEADAKARATSLEWMQRKLQELQGRLALPQTRFRERSRVEKEVQPITKNRLASALIHVEISSWSDPSRDQPDRRRFGLDWTVDLSQEERLARTDGFFPLVTNDRRTSAGELLRAHKRQPVIEKRFSQLKSGFHVAPVFLKDVARIEGLLCAYFFAMVTQVLLQRALRRKMRASKIPSLPLYYERRASKRPSSTLILRNLQRIFRHTVRQGSRTTEMVTELNDPQRRLVELFGLPVDTYGKSPDSKAKDAHPSP